MQFFIVSSFWFLLLQIVLGEQVTNPIKRQEGSDPWITYNMEDKHYYFLTTTFRDVQLTRARTLNGLKTGEQRIVYRDDNPNRCCNIWAPELHQINGTWFIYFTAGRDKDVDFQRMHVTRGGSSPWSTYTYAGQLGNDWAIDGTIATIKGRKYYYWSCQRNGLQSLCGADLISPTSYGAARLISAPMLPFERHGKISVNEGPNHLFQEGVDYLVYSASFCWTPEYSLGLLTLRAGGDPLDAGAWTKSGPLIRSANGNYGPGHNGFFKSPDGKQTWIVYHATTNPNGDCDRNRHTLVGPVNFTMNGPVFNPPPLLGTVMDGPSGEP